MSIHSSEKSLETNGATVDVGAQLKQLVVFALEDSSYGLDIQYVREINRMVEITPIPNAPDFVEGIINLRGVIVPVVDLSKRFALSEQENSKETRIVVIESKEHMLGLVVDEVSEVLRLAADQIDPANNMMTSGIALDFIEGIGKVNDQLILILSPDKLFSSKEKMQLGKLAANEA
jgi:purine-binding chemotaxis protein CheW